ncbi:amino acid synthesis family protein [Castellaniella sp. S9]|uniref:amino acid synthesis family protein n=1 Tax=Castellaniella sp. S9 TaxID=2993652 RepID=UPI0022B49BED|nr:amino acid synthesis family protein [Castellaniella sp. S9]
MTDVNIKLAKVRQFHLFERETLREAGVAVTAVSRHVVAGVVFENPLAGKGAASAEDLDRMAEISLELGAELSRRALARMTDVGRPRAYGKAVIVGTDGDAEHGAALIHPRIGLAMRRTLGAGPALIPGNAKVAGPGASIDLIFGGAEDAWDYDAMDATTVSIPGGPGPGEIALFVGFGTVRANARIQGASADQVANLVAEIRGATA